MKLELATFPLSLELLNYLNKPPFRGGSSNSSKTFAACKKHVITNSSVPNEDWEYTFEHTGTTMTVGSYSYQEIVRTESTTGDTGTAGFTSSKKDKGSGETSIAVSDFTYAYAPDVNGAPGTFSANIPSGLGLNRISSRMSCFFL